ncbi:restriction endonuclease subunit S [Vibrio cholerae]|uniref:restriction endonuclease subunit S n=1 Tax=Vibrio cholerae TaxID=666 RepID=UPI0011DC43F5|nr:restriction endonuclease subunit S [Vibrio cholerae]TXX55583.1 hypothetical protein FXF07_03530 [Vibrio cholerae]GIB85603.1 type I restriction endonuclease subunit S [Vibrio cholerae]
MTDKQTVKFGDICREVKLTTKDPIADGYERYIGLEHLDSCSLKIKRWGMIAEDNPSFTRVFKKGHILFGKRRPYLKKAAVAEFDGVCSGDIIVMEASEQCTNEKILQLIVHTEDFWSWAVRTSSGSLSPRTKFSSLSNYEFFLPEEEKQKQLVAIYEKLEQVLSREELAKNSTKQLEASMKNELLHQAANVSNWKGGKVGDICESIVPGRNKPKIFDGSIPWITTPDITEKYIPTEKHSVFVSKEELSNCGGKIVPKGAVIMTCVGELGVIGITKSEVVINQQLHAFVCPEDVIPEFLALWLSTQVNFMKSVASQTTIPYMNKSNCNSIPFYYPGLEEQIKIVERFNQLGCLTPLLNRAQMLVTGLVNEFNTGR